MQAGSDFKFEIGQKVAVKGADASPNNGTITARRPGALEPGYTVELEDGTSMEVKESELIVP